MLRSLLIVFLVLFSTTAHAEGTTRDAQAMLSRLGYQISVDGSWGPQSLRVIGQFYTDRGLTYDGTLSGNEFEDLSAAVEDLGATNAETHYVHPRANLVDYSRQYNFPQRTWPYVNLESYRSKFIQIYGKQSIWADATSRFLSTDCREEFFQYDAYRNINLGSNDVTSFNKTSKLTDCLGDIADAAHQDFIANGRNSQVLNLFFHSLVPAWVENNAFSAQGMRTASHDNTSAGYTFTIDKIAFVYTRYAAAWGVSAELDMKFRIWWDQISQHDAARIYQRGYEKCREFPGPGVKPDGMMSDECMNVGTDYASALAHMGMYYKDSDYINEAIFVAGASARRSTPEAFVLDAIRGSHGAGYAMMVAQKLDEIALILDDIDVNFYEMSFAKHGRTVRDIIEVTAREFIKPDRIFDYACPNEAWYRGESCYHQENYAYYRGEIAWQYSAKLRTVAGAVWNNPDYMPFIELINPRGHVNGYGHSEGTFNRLIQLRYFPPKNRYYENDPTPDDRNVFRVNLSSDQYIQLIVAGLEELLEK